MTVLIDTANYNQERNASSARTFTSTNYYTVASADNFLVIFAEAFNIGASTFQSVYWNGCPLTFYARENNTGVSVTNEIWYLANPTAGTGKITISFGVALGGTSYLSHIPMQNVNTANPFGTAAGALTSANPGFPISVTPTGAGPGDIYIAMVVGNVTTATQTNANGTNLGANQGQSTDWIPGYDSGAFTWSGNTAGTNATAIGVAVFGNQVGAPAQQIYVMP